MPTGRTPNLDLALPVQGELSGSWGNEVNNGITDYVDIAVAGTLTLTGDGAVTLANTLGAAGGDNIGSTTAQYAILKITGTSTTKTITGPSSSKTYTVINASSYDVVVKASGQTGVTIAANTRATVAYNGTDYVLVGTNDITKLSGTLAAANGGTGLTSSGANGNVLTSNGTTWTSAALPAGGLTYVYKTANYTTQDKEGVLADTTGGAFTVTLPATPATGAQVVVADAGGNWGTNNLTVGRNGSTISGLADNLVCDISGASVQFVYDGTTWEIYTQIGGNGGTAVTLSGTQTLTNKTIAFGSNTLTDVASINTAQTFTGTKTFSGTSSALAMVLNDAAETTTVSATAATGTINYDVTTQSVLFYTTNASANWTVNFRASSGTSLNTAMAIGQSVTAAFLVTQGSTAYFNSAVQVDGSSVTPRWQGGTAPAAGNASGVDVYTYTIIKTANATFSVFAAQTRFA